jgi:hypothetical protein
MKAGLAPPYDHVRAARAQFERAIAILVGKLPAVLSIPCASIKQPMDRDKSGLKSFP